MEEMCPVRSVKHYFNEFIVEGLKDKPKIQEVDLIQVKNQVLDAFRKEIFGQIIFKIGPEAIEMSTDDLAELPPVANILKQSFRKWRRLCILCSEKGLGSFFQLEDLKTYLENRTSIEEDPEDVVVVDEETLQPVVNDNGNDS